MPNNINTTATTTLIVNGRPAIQELNRIRATLGDIQTAKNRIKAQPIINPNDKRELKRLTQEEKNLRRELKNIESATQGVHRVMKNLNKAKPSELNAALKTLNRQLKDMERGSAAWKAHTEKIRILKTELANVNKELAAQQTLWQRFTTTANRVASAIGAITAATAAMVMAGRSAVQAYADMDEQLTNTQKYTGLSREEVEKLNESFKKMDTRTGRDKLNELAQEAGRLGYNTEKAVMEYVQAADIINVALVDLGEGATQTIAKLTNIFGVQETMGVRDSMLSVGSAVNVLSQNCTASKPYLVEFAQRMAGVGAQAGLTIPQILAFGATLDANGQKMEMSASALGRLTMMLFQKPAELAKQVGLDVKNFTETLKESTYEGLMQFLGALSRLGSAEGLAVLSPLFKEMGMDGVRMSQVLSTLAKHLDMVTWETGEANKAFKQATSATREFNLFNNTTQASIDKAKKRFKELAIELGEKLVPVYRHVITSGSAMMRLLKGIVEFVIEHKVAIMTLVSAILYFKGAQLAVNGIVKVWNGLLTVAKGATLMLSYAYNTLTGHTFAANRAMVTFNQTIKANPIGFAVGMVVALVAAIESLVGATKQEEEAHRQARVEALKHYAEMRDISQQYTQAMTQERLALNLLFEAATNESLAKEKRLEALQKLQQLYPDYFGNMNLETILSDRASLAYNKLAANIIMVAKAKAAAAKIQENESKILELEMQRDQLKNNRLGWVEQKNQYQYVYERLNETPFYGYNKEGRERSKKIGDANSKIGQALLMMRVIDMKMGSINNEISKYEEANKWLQDTYGVTTEQLINSPESVPTGFGGIGGAGGGSGKNKGGGKHGGSDGSNKFHAEDVWKQQALNANLQDWYAGLITYKQFTDRLYDIDIEYLEKKIKNTKATEKEIDTFQKQLAEARVKKMKHEQAELEAEMKMRQKMAEEEVKLERKKLELESKEEVSSLTTRYMYGMMTQRAYTQAKLQIELQYLDKIKALYAENTKERAEIEKKQLDLLNADKLEKQKEYQKKITEFYNKYFDPIVGMSDTEKQEQYNVASASLLMSLDRALIGADGDEKKIAEIRKQYERARKDLEDSFNKRTEKEDNEKSPLKRWLMKWIKAMGLSDDESKAVLDTATNMANSLGSIWSSITAMQDAEIELQINQLTKRYDAEISMAEGNAYRVKEIEKKKQKEIKKLKDQQLKRQMAIQIVQAVATTAEGAINAYTSAMKMPYPANMILAPLAAAIATAAGMMQVATIRKQAAATSSGYAEGGFTKKGSKYEPAGIVHAGEWVASQKLVNSPVTRPMIEALDYAQKHNTIGSLRAGDASEVVMRSTPTLASGASVSAVIAQLAIDMQRQNQVIDALNNRLNEPFVTVNTVTGDNGTKKAQEEYNRMINNATPSRKRIAI